MSDTDTGTDTEIVTETDRVTVRYCGRRTVRLASSAKAERSMSGAAPVRDGVDEYAIEWADHEAVPEGLPDERVHYRPVGCPTCKINARAVFRGYPDDPHYECLVCGYTNAFDPADLPAMRRSAATAVEDGDAP